MHRDQGAEHVYGAVLLAFGASSANTAASKYYAGVIIIGVVTKLHSDSVGERRKVWNEEGFEQLHAHPKPSTFFISPFNITAQTLCIVI